MKARSLAGGTERPFSVPFLHAFADCVACPEQWQYSSRSELLNYCTSGWCNRVEGWEQAKLGSLQLARYMLFRYTWQPCMVQSARYL
jgi:hypothetical protein